MDIEVALGGEPSHQLAKDLLAPNYRAHPRFTHSLLSSYALALEFRIHTNLPTAATLPWTRALPFG